MLVAPAREAIDEFTKLTGSKLPLPRNSATALSFMQSAIQPGLC
jgi:hypothetical protein